MDILEKEEKNSKLMRMLSENINDEIMGTISGKTLLDDRSFKKMQKKGFDT
ncbi:MAG: hypothetical protein LBO09_00650 [Candidatus Peribacteria bacterium]|jgi:hypothetical protein|nr:hypothetical protein [Candidatus Peribacteria bacterium]